MRFLALTIVLSFAFNGHAYEERPEKRTAQDVLERCETTKEFITTLEYFRKNKQYGLDDADAVKTASQVAKGCTGAAERFVKAFELLIKSDAGPRSSLKVAIHLSNKPPEYCETFIAIFKQSFLAEYLDLDYSTAFDIAHALATDYKGHPKIAASDFGKLVEFCMSDKNVGLSKPRCGVIAARIVKKTERFQALMAAEFIKIFNFLTNAEGPASPIVKALETAEHVVSFGPEAADNFISAYNYAASGKGLNMTASQALDFSKNLSTHTWDKVRGPASVSTPNASSM